MDRDIGLNNDPKEWWRENKLIPERGRLFCDVKHFQNTIGDYITLGLSGLAFIVSLTCLVFGMVNGFWSGNNAVFSFYAITTSPSGIIMLLGYFVSLNMFYFHFVRVKKLKLTKDKF